MMIEFLNENREELIERCKVKVDPSAPRDATDERQKEGTSLFLDQLARTLMAVKVGNGDAQGSAKLAFSEAGPGAALHDKALQSLGWTIDQVIHGYGDLCRAIADLAQEKHVRFGVDESRTLDRCLDDTIADAVAEFSSRRDNAVADRWSSEPNMKVGSLLHELSGSLQMASLATQAIELGSLTMRSATGSVLKRSLDAMRRLLDTSLEDGGENKDAAWLRTSFSLAALLEDIKTSARFVADVRDGDLVVAPVSASLRVEGNRDRLLGALANLISNALKFTHPHTSVNLDAYLLDGRVYIDVKDQCGGLSSSDEESMFLPRSQPSDGGTGLGTGLAEARQTVESDDGTLTFRNLTDVGCVFTIELPSRAGESRA